MQILDRPLDENLGKEDNPPLEIPRDQEEELMPKNLH